MNGNFVDGLLTKKKIRSSGRISWAIATNDCALADTIPVNHFAPIIGQDPNGQIICASDVIELNAGEPLSAELCVVLIDKYGHHHFAPNSYHWFFGQSFEYKPDRRSSWLS